MTKRSWYLAGAIAALGTIILIFSLQSGNPAPASEPIVPQETAPSSTAAQIPPAPEGVKPAPPKPAPVTENPAPKPPEQVTVTYTDEGYSPSTVAVPKGTTVVFKNQSSGGMWTASNVHPTHTLYPTTGGCLGSTFDECAAGTSGTSWSFKFDIAGTWKYHNHVSPSKTGTVVVQ